MKSRDSGKPARESESCRHLLTCRVAVLSNFRLPWVVAILKVGLNNSAGQMSGSLSFPFTSGLNKGRSPDRAGPL